MPATVSIRKSLLVNLVIMVVVMRGAIVATTFLGSRHAVRKLSESVIRQTLDNVEMRLERFFAEPTRQLLLGRQRAEAGFYESPSDQDAAGQDGGRDIPALHTRLNLLLAPLIEHYPQVSSLMIADSRGREHMLLYSGGRWRNRITRRDQWGDQVRWLEWSQDAPAPRQENEKLDYDPRRRPWHKDAIETLAQVQNGASAVHWTEPCFFFTTKEPGITASVTFKRSDGHDHVLAFDVLLNDISRFTRGLRVGTHGKVIVLTDDFCVIGLPADPRFDDPRARGTAHLKRPAELGLDLVTEAAAAFEARSKEDRLTVRFAAGGVPWWARMGQFNLSPQRRLLIDVLVPEADLLGNLPVQRAVILGGVLAVLLVGIARAAALSRRFSEPIETLVVNSDRIGSGDFEAGDPINSNVAEIQRLADAQDQYSAALLSAGQGPMLFYEAGADRVQLWKGDIPPLALVRGLTVPPARPIHFEPGDMLVLTTDGFFEWRNRKREQFGIPRLRQFVLEHHKLAPANFIDALHRTVLEFAAGTAQDDDLTALVIRKS